MPFFSAAAQAETRRRSPTPEASSARGVPAWDKRECTPDPALRIMPAQPANAAVIAPAAALFRTQRGPTQHEPSRG